MKTLSLNQMEVIQGGDFWGIGDCSPVSGTENYFEGNGGMLCTMDWLCNEYVFWIKTGTTITTGACYF